MSIIIAGGVQSSLTFFNIPMLKNRNGKRSPKPKLVIRPIPTGCKTQVEIEKPFPDDMAIEKLFNL